MCSPPTHVLSSSYLKTTVEFSCRISPQSDCVFSWFNYLTMSCHVVPCLVVAMRSMRAMTDRPRLSSPIFQIRDSRGRCVWHFDFQMRGELEVIARAVANVASSLVTRVVWQRGWPCWFVKSTIDSHSRLNEAWGETVAILAIEDDLSVRQLQMATIHRMALETRGNLTQRPIKTKKETIQGVLIGTLFLEWRIRGDGRLFFGYGGMDGDSPIKVMYWPVFVLFWLISL